VERGIIDSISARHLRDILKRCDIRPHRYKYWLTSPDLQVADFDARVEEICRLYQEAPDANRHDGIHTVCIDEPTGIQAQERIAPDLPKRPGDEANLEFEYRRNGTISLFGNLHVPTCNRSLMPDGVGTPKVNRSMLQIDVADLNFTG
jgi:hypothetical protein